MFNVFLPKLLETSGAVKSIASDEKPAKSLEQSLWDVVIFTLGGCPGAIVSRYQCNHLFAHVFQLGAYMVETPLGRRWSLAGSTFVTAFFCLVFALVQSSWAVTLSTIGISLSATVRLKSLVALLSSHCFFRPCGQSFMGGPLKYLARKFEGLLVEWRRPSPACKCPFMRHRIPKLTFELEAE